MPAVLSAQSAPRRPGEYSGNNQSLLNKPSKNVLSEGDGHLYEFGGYRLDVKACALKRGGEKVALAPKAFEVLRLLVERRGAVVSKQEMMEEVWAGSFVEEANMTQSVYMLRKVLGKNEEGQDYIENVPRRGYRFAVPVRLVGANGAAGAGEAVAIESPPPAEPPAGRAELPPPEEQTPAGARPPAVRRRIFGSALWLGAGLGALAALAALLYFYWVKAAPKSPGGETVFQKLTFTGDISVPVISPDGLSFAYERGGSLYVQDVKTGNNIRLNIPGHRTFGHLQFSTGGESVYFRDRTRVDLSGDVWQVSRFGGEARRVAENVWGGFGLSPDGREIAFVRFHPEQAESALLVRSLETGEERRLQARKPPEDFYRGKPAWAADGRRLAVVVQTPGEAQSSKLFVVDARTGAAEQVNVARLYQLEQPAWTPAGDAILIVGREDRRFMQLWRVSYPEGSVRRITNDPNIYRGLSLSADGKNLLAYQYTFYSHLWVAPAADPAAAARQVTFGNLNRDGNAGLAWTPDGSLVYCSRVMGDRDLWVVRPSDGLRRQLTANAGGSNGEPFVTADGRHIFFESTRSGTRHIWRMDANGENPTQMTFGEREIEYRPAVSPDGGHLFYIQRGPQALAVWRKSLADGKTERLTAPGRASPAGFLLLSPGGKHLAFHNLIGEPDEGSPGQLIEIGVVPADGRGEPRFVRPNSSSSVIRWAAEGEAFDYAENAPEGAKIWRQSLDVKSPPRLVLQLPGVEIYNFAWSPDGKQLALALGRQQNDVVLLTDFE